MLKSLKKPARVTGNSFVPVDKYKEFSDEEIIRKIEGGSVPLFEVIMRRYNQRLFRIQRSYISDEHAIKDTLQLTWLKVFENLGTFKGEALFSTWITRIAINEALKYIKREKRYSAMHIASEARTNSKGTVHDVSTPESKIIYSDLKNLLEETVQRLLPKYRSVYMMREVEQMSTRETADCLQISQSNVKARLHRAKQMIREDLERRVADTEIFNFLGNECNETVQRVRHTIGSSQDNPTPSL